MNEDQLIPTPGVFGETGNFLLEREIGRGGMGGVYMGRDKMLDRPVAVKVMLKEYGSDAEFVEKFKREAQAAAKLIHPNIAQIYSYGIADGMPYIAMELVAGGSLFQLMKNAGSAADIPRVMKICEQVAQALRCAADQGLVHGDVKPENVLLDANGNAKLVDFGLAAMQKDTDEVWGTPYYIAPEKVKKEAVDYRADMYSLGGTLYHALTGVAPFEGNDASSVVRKRFETAPVPPSAVRSGISPQIDALVLKMLAFNPSDRFPSFEALLQEFGRVMATGLTVQSTPSQNGSAAGLANGGRKIVMKGRSRFKVKPASAGVVGRRGNDVDTSSRPEPEEGGVAGKVAAVIGITIGAIALVAGLLVWYVVADRNAQARDEQAQIVRKIGEARESIASTRNDALKFMENIDSLASKAVGECQKHTDLLKRDLSHDFDASVVTRIKPRPTADLLAAIALTNSNAVSASGIDTNALASAAASLGAAMEEAMQGVMAELAAGVSTASGEAVAAVMKFRPPNDDEADPASPEHETYLAEKAKWEAMQKEKLAQGKVTKVSAAVRNTTVVSGKRKSAKSAEYEDALNTAIRNMNDLWVRAYDCQAAAIRLRYGIDALVEKIDTERFDGNGSDTMERAAAFSKEVRYEFDKIKSSDDVSKIQKAGSYIRSKGSQTVKQTNDRLFIIKKKIEREEEDLRKKKEDEERRKQLEKEKLETIERDNKRIEEKFDSLVSTGVFKQLDWKGATRQLTTTKDDFKYSESQLYADIFIQKVKMMATVQEVFIANCKDYKFSKFKLANCKIVEINEKEIKMLKPDGRTPMPKMNWVRFYQQYHGNLNELIVKFIEKGKNVSILQDGKKLSLQPWADAMMGAALTMQIICGDDPSAAARAEKIAKTAVKELPDYLNRAKAIFPDITFDADPED